MVAPSSFISRRIHQREISPRFKVVALVVLTIFLSILHHFTMTSEEVVRDVIQHLFIFPIILGALWFGSKGGVGITFFIGLTHIPHFFFSAPGAVQVSDNTYFAIELILLTIVGCVLGCLSQEEIYRKKQLQQANISLAESYQILQKQTLQVMRMEEQLRQDERASVAGELAAMFVHEIKNPLASIRGAVEILNKDYQPGNKKLEFFDILFKETERLNRVAGDFMRLNKPLQIIPTTCNLFRDIADIVMLVKAENTHKDKNIELQVDDSIEIMADRDRLHQAFFNIIINAMQAMEEKGTLLVEARRYDKEGEPWVNINFRDRGNGIAENDHENIFKPFFTTKKEGSGLGLVITKKIIMAHKGTIEVASNNGKGSVFSIFLPADSQALSREHGE